MKRENRSDKYQYLLLETPVSHDTLSLYSNQNSISFQLDPFEYDERIQELQDELKSIFWETVDKPGNMTEYQKGILHMRAEGKTQMEIADHLGINQSGVCKALYGNISYKDKDKDGKNKKFGGSYKKLKKILGANPRVKEILDQLSELRQEKW